MDKDCDGFLNNIDCDDNNSEIGFDNEECLETHKAVYPVEKIIRVQ